MSKDGLANIPKSKCKKVAEERVGQENGVWKFVIFSGGASEYHSTSDPPYLLSYLPVTGSAVVTMAAVPSRRLLLHWA